MGGDNNYQDTQPYNKRTLEKAFASRGVKSICEALVFVALNDSDWRRAQNKCLELLSNESSDVRGLAGI